MESSNKKRHDRPDYGRQHSSGSTSSHAAMQVSAASGVSAHSQALFLQKVKESSEAVNRGDFRTAIQAYTDAISLDPTNHILYTNRSAAFAKIQQFQKSLLDARKARELNPKWAKAYIREGTALQQLGQHADALAAFASGLAHDAGNPSLLSGLSDAALKCPLKEKLEPIFQQLQKLKLDKSPFVIISVIGQELLQAGHYHASVQMLEAALKIGSCSLKLRGSVFSALSSAYWGLGNIDKAITYMQKDLQVAKSLGDADGECRAYGNLGSAYFSKGHYKEALSHDRFQLVLAMRLKDRQTATVALGRLGHVYTAIGDYPNALQSHKQCVLLLKQSNEKLSEAREIGNVGAVYLAMGNFESAVECHLEHLNIAKGLKNSVEEARSFSNLGSAYHYKRNYEKAVMYHKQVLKIAEQKGDKSLEARAYAGLGHAARCMQDYNMSKTYHEKQLDNALQTRDKVAEGRACSNLGIIFHQLGEYEAALKLHKVHLSIAKGLGDRASQGRALGNIGNAYSALNKYEQAIKYHKQELAISTEVNDRHSEGSTHGNLAVAYQALKMMDSAHQHYVAHLNISRELKDPASEGRAVCNLGNFHSSRGEYANSIPYYDQYLMLSQELHDSEGEAKACFCLGYAHFALGNYLESVRYYKQDLSIAQDLKDQLGIARAYCNLGLAYKALNNMEEALDCQKKCLNLMTSLKNVKGRFRSMGNIGDILLKTGDTSEAIKFYNQQLQLAKQCNNRDMLAVANGALGAAHRFMTQYDKALGFHTQELSIRQDMNDLRGECRAHGNLGNVHMCLGKYMNAFKCYEEQLEKSRELEDSAMEANACGNLAITKMNMGNFEEAIGLFEQQLAMLEQVHGNNATFDKGRAFGNLGDCYEALGDFEESIKCHEQYLAIAQNAGNLCDQDKAYRGLGNAHRSVGNLQQALVCFEKRLVVAHELNSSAAKASAYGELGCLHSLLGNFEQAISCLQHQLSIAQEMEDSLCEGEAACGLGGVYQQMGEYDKALEYHEMDLKIAEKTNNTACQCRAYGNLGLSNESLGEYEKAIRYQEQHLSIAAQMNDRVAKTLAYSSLGRVHHALNNHPQAVEYLRQGLQIAEQLGRMEDEAKIRHRLGLALWGKGDFEECQQQLYKASELFESIRRDAQFNSEYKLSLFDLQTACYQALQRVLVTLDRHQEALVVAERACTRAFIDLLMERQAGSEGFFGNHVTDPPPITTDQIASIVSKQKSLVLYLSVAAGFLYSWLLTPRDGVVKFHETSMAEVESEVDGSDNISMKSSISFSTCSLLDNFVGQIRESMGVESHAPSGIYRAASRSISLDNESDSEDHWEQHLEELGDKLNAENDRTGFLRIVNRNHLFNSSNYSLGSLFSVSASLNGCNASFPGASVSRKNSVRNKFGNKSAISALYQLLIEPFEESIRAVNEDSSASTSDLIIVLQGDLYLIPFSVLRKDQTMEYLFERFNLMVVPSLTSLQNVRKQDKHGRPVIDSSGAVVVGNPKLTPSICQHWHLHDIPASEYEARIVGEILTARPFIGQEATKVAVLNQLEQVEVIHFATHISWKLSSVILSPGEVPSHPARFPTIDSDDSASDISTFDGPSLAEYLLTAADILNLKLHAKLVVLSAGYTDDRAGRINSDGVVGLTRSLLSAGAQCVVYCLWPIPDQASKLLMRTLYVGLQEGKYVSQALTFAVKTVQSTKQFSHPSNWGGWVMMGQDVKLSSKVAQMGHAICELLLHPNHCREAMRVLLHLIEKSLQRIHQGMKNSMYTTAQSIENKVSGISGWKDLLQAVGFRFEPSLNGLPPAVFFPQSDPGDRLTQASASLQALLGLPQGAIPALSKFLSNYEAGEAIIRVMRDILSKMAAKDNNMDVKVNVKLWRVPGCHEFLASLSMDLVEVGNDEITLRLGKQANKRHLQFALQSLVSVFDTQEAPRSLALDSSSSLESLSSSHSGSTSTSNFSKGSTPPLSPKSKKKSLFNPAEMEKMRIRNSRMSQGGLTGRRVVAGKSLKPGVNDPALCLQYQNQIKTMYRTGVSSPASSNDVYITGLSDSDTQNSCMDSPTLGSSSASEKFRSLDEVESYDLSFDGRSDKSDPKSYVSENRSGHSSVSEEGRDKDKHTSVNDDHVSDSKMYDLSFKRNGENRNSDISDNSSQGIQADSEKRGSDMSDLSVQSEGRLTPKNQRDLEAFLATTDESGIVSETTSSNQSEGSHQSDQTNFRFDPTALAQKIMTDVSEHKMALDSIQKQSIIQSQNESNIMRSEYQNQVQSSVLSTQTQNDQSVHDTGTKVKSENTSNSVNSVQSKLQTFSGPSQSAFTSPTHTGRVPPIIPSKPTFQTSAQSFRNLSANVSNLAEVSNDNDTDKSSTHTEISDSSADTVSTSSVFTTQAIIVSKKDSFSSSSSVNTTMSFSSFRPPNKPGLAESVSSLAQYRPDSATSTSSYCSTPSSVKSVIYKPYAGENRGTNNDSPFVGSYDSSSEQTSGSGSASTLTPTLNVNEAHSEVSTHTRDASPALSTCSSASSKSGKQKKKVSFSDSEPSDTPSPLNSSASSNQLSYFDLNRTNLSGIPSRAMNTNLIQQQSSLHNTSNSSVDSVGRANSRPPPPSYQYAIKNSQYVKQPLTPTGENGTSSSQPSRASLSSCSSLNNSMDESGHNQALPRTSTQGMSPRRYPASNSVPNSPMHKSKPGSPLHRLPNTESFNAQIQQGLNPPANPQSHHTATGQASNYQNIMYQHQTPLVASVPPMTQSQPAVPQRLPIKPAVPVRSTPQCSRPTSINLSGSQFQHATQSTARSHVSPARDQGPGGQYAPNTQTRPPFSPTKTALLRQPLSPESNMSPQEYFPPPPPQFREPSENPVSLSKENMFRNPSVSMSQPHPGYNMNEMGNFQQQQDHYPGVQYNGLNSHTSPSHMYDKKDFPPNMGRLVGGGTTANDPVNFVKDKAVKNQLRQMSVGNSPARKNPPVPPARIDSWENMDRHLLNGSLNQRSFDGGNLYQQINSANQGVLQTGNYVSSDGKNMGISSSAGTIINNTLLQGKPPGKYTVYPPRSQNGNYSFSDQPQVRNDSQGSQQFANGNTGTFKGGPNPLPVGPLRRVNIGSDKRSFSKTSVFQASKC